MIVGLATLISILFFGGVSETFLVDKLEKGVKQYVLDKERKKEITADLKVSVKYIKAFNKERKSKFKSFQDLNANRLTSREELTLYFDELMNDRKHFQERVIGDRISILNKIESDEWELILINSKESIDKVNAKTQKKLDKGKISEPFEKTTAVIAKVITDKERKEKLDKALNTFIDSQEKTFEKLESMNTIDSGIISNKDASEKDLIKLAKELNELRKLAFNDLTSFHFSVKEFTTQAEWEQIMKAFNKELNITSH